jgi:phospholipase/carboxylesterase
MRADDLAPFGASLGLPGLFLFPDAPVSVSRDGREGRAWWHIDDLAREAALARGDERDLALESPLGLPAARALLKELVEVILERWPARPLFIGGFSQGAMLTLDLLLRGEVSRPAGAVLLSSGRITLAEWTALFPNVRGLPIFQSHGRHDRELAFAPALALHQALLDAGAEASFMAFEGGHEIPLPVLRELKRFIRKIADGRRRGS